MKLLLVTFGSLGDVQPFVALGLALRTAGHDVAFCTASRFERQVSGEGLSFAPITDALLRRMDSELGRTIMGGEAGVVATLRAGLKLNALAKPINKQMMIEVWRAAEAIRPDAIIYHPKILAAPSIADKLQVPAIMASLQPIFAPTAAFPAPGLPDLSLPTLPMSARDLSGWYNRRTYDLVKLGYGAYRGLIDAFRHDVLGLPGLVRGTGFLRRSNGEAIPMLHAFSGHVVPRPDDWPPQAVVSGYWFQDRQVEWRPPPDLEVFLKDGEAPVYVGFGSMSGRDPKALGELVVAALRRAGVRGLLGKGWGGLQVDPGSPDMHVIEHAPHDWLFRKVAAVVHHGGAGTTAAGLRAGRVSVICPFFGDQPFWAARVHALGAGPKPIARRKLTVERLAEAISTAVSAPDMARQAERLGQDIRSEDGVANAVRFIEERVTRK